jgi:hypothetical protein
MGEYKKPKARVHHEFVYLNHDTILNALSAFEAGKVDEIIEKTSAANEGGVEGGLSAGPAKIGGGKKRQRTIQEELVRTRTWFSAFDAWYAYLIDKDAIGTFDAWDEAVREELSVGDTLEFVAEVRLSPLHQLLATFTSFAAGAGTPGSPFQMKTSELAETKKTARMVDSWMQGRGGGRNISAYFLPGRVASPRMIARLTDQYLIGGLDQIEGEFSVISQVDRLLGQDEQESVIRVLRDVPPTPKEIQVMTEAMRHFAEPGQDLGVEVSDDDLTFSYPTVVLRPIAIFR